MEYERDMQTLTRIMEQRKESLERAKVEYDNSSHDAAVPVGVAFQDSAYLAMIK